MLRRCRRGGGLGGGEKKGEKEKRKGLHFKF